MYEDKPRRSKPNAQVLVRRFFREVQHSRLLSEAKNRRFFSKDPSRTARRISARRQAMIKKLKRGY